MLSGTSGRQWRWVRSSQTTRASVTTVTTAARCPGPSLEGSRTSPTHPGPEGEVLQQWEQSGVPPTSERTAGLRLSAYDRGGRAPTLVHPVRVGQPRPAGTGA